MLPDELLEDSLSKLQSLSGEELLEVIQIIHSKEFISRSAMSKVCKVFNLSIGDKGLVEINQNAPLIASLSLLCLSFSEDGLECPIFFNQQRENMLIQHIDGELFFFKGLELINELEEEESELFAGSMRSTRYGFIIDSRTILNLVTTYTKYNNVAIAINEYLINSRDDCVLLSDFSVSELPIIKSITQQGIEIMEKMLREQRLDLCSINTFLKAKER